MVVPSLTRVVRENRRREEEIARLLKEEAEEESPEHPWFITHPLRNNVSGGVWNGWNAALIVSKQKGLGAIARDGLGKRKRCEASKSEQQDSAENKDNQDFSVAHPSAFCLDEMGEDEIKLSKEGIDVLTMHVLAQVKFVRLLKEFLGKDLYRDFVESLFRSIAKFVLSVFDKEDFERIYHGKEIDGQWNDFCAMLPEPGIGKEEVAIKKVIEESCRFPALREHDFCQILSKHSKGVEALVNEETEFYGPAGIYDANDAYGGLLHAPFKFKLRYVKENGIGKRVVRGSTCKLINKGYLQEDDISSRNHAIDEVMKNFVHLKEECKTRLALELTCGNSYRVYDTLVIEALKGIKIDGLLELCDREPSLEGCGSLASKVLLDDLFSSKLEVVQLVLDELVIGLYELGWLKSVALKYSEDALASCLLSAFGPCEAEVIEVIKIADNERRLNSRRSISLEDIKYGLSVSGLGGFVKRIPGSHPPNFSIIEFFQVLRRKANNAGDNEVGLEHLVMALHTVLRKEQRKDALLVNILFDKRVARRVRRKKSRKMNKKLGRSWEEYSPVSSILNSRYRVLSTGYFAGAGDSIEFVTKLRNSSEDISWIRKDTADIVTEE